MHQLAPCLTPQPPHPTGSAGRGQHVAAADPWLCPHPGAGGRGGLPPQEGSDDPRGCSPALAGWVPSLQATAASETGRAVLAPFHRLGNRPGGPGSESQSAHTRSTHTAPAGRPGPSGSTKGPGQPGGALHRLTRWGLERPRAWCHLPPLWPRPQPLAGAEGHPLSTGCGDGFRFLPPRSQETTVRRSCMKWLLGFSSGFSEIALGSGLDSDSVENGQGSDVSGPLRCRSPNGTNPRHQWPD